MSPFSIRNGAHITRKCSEFSARVQSLARPLLGEGLAAARLLGPAGLALLADLVDATLGGDVDVTVAVQSS